ncbi:uncharacterized protein MKZ38_004130 [Zalerion maritima]|uniref:Uncharacterized protein n=1 Tax=Zalerion maritima TaxID=339359 RepID=A0AAD5RM16_9PEZI|nr:uncharacterized protein MKZ38_004130 [Zalerion maritima]
MKLDRAASSPIPPVLLSTVLLLPLAAQSKTIASFAAKPTQSIDSDRLVAEGCTPVPTEPPDPAAARTIIKYFESSDDERIRWGGNMGQDLWVGGDMEEPVGNEDYDGDEDSSDFSSHSKEDGNVRRAPAKRATDDDATATTEKTTSTSRTKSPTTSSPPSTTKKTTTSSSTSKNTSSSTKSSSIRGSTTEWVTGRTCGWKTNSPSSAWMCGTSSTCITASGAVGCKKSGSKSLIQTCFDFTDYINESCNDLSSGTGCCTSIEYPACGTYFWADHPSISMIRCFASTTSIILLDEPKYLVDGSAYSATATEDVSGPGSTASATDDGEDAAMTVTSTSSSDSDHDSSSDGSSKAGPIAGGVIGGVVALGLVAGGMFLYRRNEQKRRAQHEELGASELGAGGNGGVGGSGGEYKDTSSVPQLAVELPAEREPAYEMMGDTIPPDQRDSPKWPGPDDRVLREHGTHSEGSTTFPPTSLYTGNNRAVSGMSNDLERADPTASSRLSGSANARSPPVGQAGLNRSPSKAGTIIGGELDGGGMQGVQGKGGKEAG